MNCYYPWTVNHNKTAITDVDNSPYCTYNFAPCFSVADVHDSGRPTKPPGMSSSDNKGDRDSRSPLGRGTLDFAALLGTIERTGWHGTIGFETRGATLLKSVNFLNSLAPH